MWKGRENQSKCCQKSEDWHKLCSFFLESDWEILRDPFLWQCCILGRSTQLVLSASIDYPTSPPAASISSSMVLSSMALHIWKKTILFIYGNTSKSCGCFSLCCIKIFQSPSLNILVVRQRQGRDVQMLPRALWDFFTCLSYPQGKDQTHLGWQDRQWAWPRVCRCTSKSCSHSRRSRDRSNNSAHGCLFNIFVVLIPALQRDLVQPFITAEDASWQYLTTIGDSV